MNSKTRDSAQALFIKGDKKFHQIHIDNVLFIKAYGNYTKINLSDQTIVSHEKISSYDTILFANHFLRVHKSYIVAINKINLVEGNRITINEHIIAIGQTYKERILKLIKR